jgi:tetratricopeptide (TPR) repeat protein
MNTQNNTNQEVKTLSDLYYQRAEILMGLKQYQKSIDDFKRIISLKVNVKSDVYLKLAECQRKNGEYENAINSINEAMMMSGEPVPEYYIERGLSYFELQKYQVAARDLSDGLNVVIYNPEAIVKLALSYEKLGNLHGTMENMMLAAEQGDSTAIEYLKNLGSNYSEEELNNLY